MVIHTPAPDLGPIWDRIQKELDEVSKKYDVPVRIAILGFAKAGKSTLFNALFGEDVQETGAQTDLTMQDREARKFGVIFTDTPGFGTRKFTLDETKEKVGAEDSHLIIHCINGMGGISDDDAELYEFCRDTGKHTIVAVTKADVMKEKEITEFGQSVREKIDATVEPIFISAETGLNMTALVRRIQDLLPEAVRDVFIAKQRVDFDAKRKKSRAVIHSAAIAAAAIAVSPVPVSDVVLIIPIQAGMVASIGKIFGYEMTTARAKEIIAVAGGGCRLALCFPGARQVPARRRLGHWTRNRLRGHSWSWRGSHCVLRVG